MPTDNTDESADCSDLRKQLLEFPKAPIETVPTGIQAQTKYLWLMTLILAGVGVAAYLLSIWSKPNRIAMYVAIGILVVIPGPAIITLTFQLWTWTQLKKLRDMASGKYYVRWPIAQVPWERMMQERDKANDQIPRIISSLLGVVILLLVTAIRFDNGHVFFGSELLHFTVPTAVAAAIGYLIGKLCLIFANMTDHIMRTREPQVLIGPEGIYMTGIFWPLNTFGQKLVTAKIDAGVTLLRCSFRISTKHGSRTEMLKIPYPPERTDESQLVAQLLNEPPESD